ncbi:hypothetical protein LHGZ1_2497 [Laribacter hongkongensis]|uniref:Uncharacterized protein n=1 Tax=Laribacter hongkongensis TaxID=168471 RepID=A0A248LKR4_9NEIS|nr:hypothetical protein LHGZ1_2497 [Laribacter hongkongensis]
MNCHDLVPVDLIMSRKPPVSYKIFDLPSGLADAFLQSRAVSVIRIFP